MKKYTSGKDNFEDYLLKLEAKEKRQTKKRILMLLPLLVLLGILCYQFFGPQVPTTINQTRIYRADELDLNKVLDLFDVDNAGFVIDHPLLGMDTIKSPREYSQLISLVSQAKEDKDAIDNMHISDSIRVAAEGTLEVFEVDVAGDRRVGNRLVFTVENYDPEVKYLLDFGNGIKRNIQRTTTYIYPLPGHFVMQLFATNPQKGASVYTKKYEIKPLKNQTDTSNTRYLGKEEDFS